MDLNILSNISHKIFDDKDTLEIIIHIDRIDIIVNYDMVIVNISEYQNLIFDFNDIKYNKLKSLYIFTYCNNSCKNSKFNFGNLINLSLFYYYGTMIIDEYFTKEINKLTNLRQLHLISESDNAEFVDYINFTNFNLLTNFEIKAIKAILPDKLFKLKNLKSLIINTCKISNVSKILKLTKLKYLTIYFYDNSIIEILKYISSLKAVSFIGNYTNIIKKIGKCYLLFNSGEAYYRIKNNKIFNKLIYHSLI